MARALPLASLFLMREVNPSNELQRCRELTDHLSLDLKSWLFSPDHRAAMLVSYRGAGIQDRSLPSGASLDHGATSHSMDFPAGHPAGARGEAECLRKRFFRWCEYTHMHTPAARREIW